ncbi:hypothetical protein SERLA73DRAFT_72615 [Serpula lacrymans var. lacrymans S7.3]|uniref:Homeobox domain-containing protein n=1 Tax=Serpula lacrymans var. lacrymans (strain S7.3) TaxID=936435 RepID=F8PVL2_SERL3|nr:hypothetical protein SERLA73DRAFT_72615 [Serpula lacrymans var. lacrymans S7.3]
MTNPRDDRFYGSLGKSRKSPPGGDVQSSVFQGQGGRYVLPPLDSAFPTSRSPAPSNYSNQYLQPRSSQVRSDHNASLYGQWSNTAPAQQHSPTYYEHGDSRYPSQQTYPSYSSRTPPTLPGDAHTSRKLPPLNVPSSTVRDDRWQAAAFGPMPTHMSGYSEIRSPTATYPPEYASYQQQQQHQHQTSYSYPPVPDQRSHPNQMSSVHHAQQISMGAYSTERGLPSHIEAHGTSPYARNHHPSLTNTAITQEPVSLKVLNETYNRTAFPSTEERADLARKLDMSARSVQIWFQNKRQSMRQTSRQSSTSVTSSSHQPFSMTSQSDDLSHPSVGGYGGGSMGSTISGQTYLPRSPQENRASVHASQSPIVSHRRRSDEEDPRKWSARGY